MGYDICGSELCNIAIDHIVPLVGCIPLMYIVFAPVPTVRKIERDRDAGLFNITLYAMLELVSLGFTLYGLFLRNYYILVLFLVGLSFFIASLGIQIDSYVISAMRYAPDNVQTRAIFILVIGTGLIFLVCMLTFITFVDQPKLGQALLGSLTCILLISMNISAFISLPEIIRKKDASFIYLPAGIGIFITGVIWTIYGILLRDPFILVANSVATLSGALQITLRLVFPAKHKPGETIDFKNDVLPVSQVHSPPPVAVKSSRSAL